jgi:hypothetical protein
LKTISLLLWLIGLNNIGDMSALISPHFLFQIIRSSDLANFDPLGINSDLSSTLSSTWKNVVSLFPQAFESSSNTEKEKPRGVAGLVV